MSGSGGTFSSDGRGAKVALTTFVLTLSAIVLLGVFGRSGGGSLRDVPKSTLRLATGRPVASTPLAGSQLPGPSAGGVPVANASLLWARAGGSAKAMLWKGAEAIDAGYAWSGGFVLSGHDAQGAIVWTSDGRAWNSWRGDVFREAIAIPFLVRIPSGVLAVGEEPSGKRREGASPGNVELAMWTTRDGLTWRRLSASVLAPFGGAVISLVGTGAPGIIALGTCGTGTCVWTSPDGTRWSAARPLPALLSDLASLRDVATAESGYVLLQAEGAPPTAHPAVWLSRDGRTWRRLSQALPDGIVPDRLVASDGHLLVFARTAARNVAMPLQMWGSADGERWTRLRTEALPFPAPVPIPGCETTYPLLAAGGGWFYVVAGTGGAWRSRDGTEWEQLPQRDPPILFDRPGSDWTGSVDIGHLAVAGRSGILLALTATNPEDPPPDPVSVWFGEIGGGYPTVGPLD